MCAEKKRQKNNNWRVNKQRYINYYPPLLSDCKNLTYMYVGGNLICNWLTAVHFERVWDRPPQSGKNRMVELHYQKMGFVRYFWLVSQSNNKRKRKQ